MKIDDIKNLILELAPETDPAYLDSRIAEIKSNVQQKWPLAILAVAAFIMVIKRGRQWR